MEFLPGHTAGEVSLTLTGSRFAVRLEDSVPEQRSASPGEIEDACLEADAWADALDEWAASRAHLASAADATSLAGMLRALARPLRLSLLVEGGESDQRCLLEEVRSGIATAQSFGPREKQPRSSRSLRSPAVEVSPISMATPANGQYRVSNPWKNETPELPSIGRVTLASKSRGPKR